MSNNNLFDEKMSPAEFVQLANEGKIQLIDGLAGTLLKLGEEYALTAAEYYRQKVTGKDNNFAQLTFKYKSLEIRYDVLKHVMSALQSTLKAEKAL